MTTVAAANVTTKITLVGQDRASAQIDKAGAATKKVSKALDDAAKSSTSFASALSSLRSGSPVETLRAMSSMLKGGGGGLVGSLGMAAAGIGGIAVALSAVALQTTKWSIELERLRAQMRFAFGPDGEDAAFAFADAVGGVGVESVVKLQTTLKASGVDAKVTVEQLQRLANAATAMGKTGDDALSAFADAVRSGTTESLKQVGVFVNSELALKAYAHTLGMASAEGLTQAQRGQAVLNATLAELPRVAQAGTNAYARQDAALAKLENAWTALKLELSEIVAGPAVDIVESVNKISDAVGDMTRGVKLAVKLAVAPVTAIIGAIDAAFKSLASLATGAGKVLDAIKSRDPRQIAAAFRSAQDDIVNSVAEASKAAALATPGVGMAIKQWEAYTEAAQNTADKTKETTSALIAEGGAASGLTQTLAQLAQAQGIAAETTKLAGEASRKAAEQRRRAAEAARKAAERRRKLAEQDRAFMDDLIADEEALRARRVEIARQEIDAAQAVADKLRDISEQRRQAENALITDPAAQARIAIQEAERDRVQGLIQVYEDLTLTQQERARAAIDIESTAAARMDAIHAQEMRRVGEEKASKIDMALSTAKAAVQGLEQVGIGERAAAGLKAVLAGAEAALAFTRGRYDQAVAGAFAAAQFGSVALGGGAPAPPVGTGPATAPPPPQPTNTAAAGGSGPSIIIQGVFATKAEVGAALSQALGAAAAAGV